MLKQIFADSYAIVFIEVNIKINKNKEKSTYKV